MHAGHQSSHGEINGFVKLESLPISFIFNLLYIKNLCNISLENLTKIMAGIYFVFVMHKDKRGRNPCPQCLISFH